MLFKTNGCSRFLGHELAFNCDIGPVPQPDVDWFIKHLERSVAGGTVFKDGQTMQLGWMLTRFERKPDGLLHILEPDMKSMPIEFVDSVTTTLKDFRRQQDVVLSCAIEGGPQYPTLQSAIAVSGNYDSARRYFMGRDEPENSFSGWFFKDLDASDSEVRLVSLYEFACHRPDAVKFLALPPNHKVVAEADDDIRILSGEQELPVKPGSYLELLNSTRRRAH